MAVAVLERNAENLTEEKIQLKSSTTAQMTADEQHNAKIGEIYQRLINPNAKVNEVLGRSEQPAVEATKDVFANRPVLVENARADAEIFRADSPVNRRVIDVAPQAAAGADEEENEDLRPTPTTIQYKTAGVKTDVEEGKVEITVGETKRALFSKKEKIVIAVVVSMVIALFVLIVVNSAMLSNMNAELNALQSSLTTVKASFAGINEEFNATFANALKNAQDFAFSKGMIR